MKNLLSTSKESRPLLLPSFPHQKGNLCYLVLFVDAHKVEHVLTPGGANDLVNSKCVVADTTHDEA